MAQRESKTGIIKEVRTCLKEYLHPSAKLIVGVSGGADSMALLFSLFSLGVPCIISHINYGKRGKESDSDQELVEQMSFEWGYECHTVKLNPNDVIGNFQHWAREQRYAIFEGLMEAEEADAVATAHHRDDQLETIVQKILRGSSVSTWSAMQMFDPPIFRPLLNQSKEDILNYCNDHSIPYREDGSNRDLGYARNWLRHEWAPKMDELFPGWDINLLELRNKSDAFRESIEYLKKDVLAGQSVILKNLEGLGYALKAELWRSILESELSMSKGQLDEILKLEQSQPGTEIKIGHMILTRDRENIHVGKAETGYEEPVLLNKAKAEEGFFFEGHYLKISAAAGDASVCYMDASKITFPVTIRRWESGDRFQPLGMKGTQKVSDHLTNRKVSSHLKHRALVLCSEDGTIVAILYPEEVGSSIGFISEKVKADTETNNYLIIRSET